MAAVVMVVRCDGLKYSKQLLCAEPTKLTLKKYDRRRENSRQKTDVGYLGLSSLIFSSISMRGRVSQLSHV